MFLKCHQRPHPIVKIDIAKQNIDVGINLDIFDMTISYNEPVGELINKKFLFFKRYHVDSKEIKCPLAWEKHESLFLTFGFLARQIIGILGSQIETECIFSLAGILNSLRKYCVQCDDLKKLIFVSENWLNDLELIVEDL